MLLEVPNRHPTITFNVQNYMTEKSGLENRSTGEGSLPEVERRGELGQGAREG